ncbi:MAG: tRNA pseudouridine(38-40) synthase TruA [Candidatus Cloacimonetes bacterium]|nr:tRNA pseudouridine(38-40) synthase TruA [Candidatus Cloacimonadota bacterium]
MRIAACLAYDGTAFAGWQIQNNERTVQQTIENALEKICKQPVPVTASGRTDSGVHALRQYMHLDFTLQMTQEQIHKALQSKLPDDIRIIEVWQPAPDFHARFDAISRTYHFYIANQRTPFNRHYRSVFTRKTIHPERIQSLLHNFTGEHDFSAFCRPNPDLKHYRCNVSNLTFEEIEDGYRLIITANRFLHNMVRRIVGCLVEITHKNLNEALIPELLLSKSHRQKLTPTAPPQGLFLYDVEYPQNKSGRDTNA